MEDDKHGSGSDKDRKMAGRFSNVDRGGGYEFFRDKDDDDEEKKKKKIAKKAAKKISFLGKDSAPPSIEKVEPVEDVKEKRGLNLSFLKGSEVSIETPDETIDSGSTLDKEKIDAEEVDQFQEYTEKITEDFQEVVVEHLQEVEQELERPEAQEFVNEVIADAEYLEHVGERLKEGLEPEEAIEDALEDIYEPPEMDASENDIASESKLDAEDDEDDLASKHIPISKTVPTTKSVVSPSVTPPSKPPSTPSSPVSPPLPPKPKIASQAHNPNSISTSPNMVPMNDTFYRNSRTGDVLAGGIIGNILGRRTGRNKERARFEPEIEKRDTELKDLETKLSDTEAIVRIEAAKNYYDATPNNDTSNELGGPILPQKEVIREYVEEFPAVSIEEEKNTVMAQEKQFEQQLETIIQQDLKELEQSTETTYEHVAPLESVSRQEKTVNEEYLQTESTQKLGDILVERQEKLSGNERTSSVEKQPEIKRDVRTLAMPELLKIAESISMEKTSLRELYERNRIDAVNLRRVVIEYMNGGTKYQEILHGSLEAVEMQRELRGEIKKDSSTNLYETDGSVSNNASTLSPFNTMRDDVSEKIKSDESVKSRGESTNSGFDEDSSLLTNGTAIILGILTGVALMVALLLYSNSI